jgi:peptidoglycan/LPS O-acetylase OafA/YrhL
MLVHLQLIEPVLGFICPGGKLGVDVFFALSGFLITSLLLSESESSGSIDLKHFYYRRALRLLPALTSVFLFTVLIAFVVGSFEALGLSRLRLASTALYFTNWVRAYQGPDTWFLGHFWSLAIEEQFYLCWPVLLVVATRFRIKPRTMCLAVLGLIGASVVLKIGLYASGATTRRIFFGSDTRGDGILVGCVLAFALKGGLIPTVLNESAARSLKLIGFLLLGIFVVVGDDRFPLIYLGGTTVVAFAATLLIAGSILNRSNASRDVLSTSLLRWLGRRSYGLYLWHWPIYELARLVPYRALVVPCAIVVSIAVAALSFRFLETPFLQIKDRTRTSGTEFDNQPVSQMIPSCRQSTQ